MDGAITEAVMEARNQALLERLAHFSLKANERLVSTMQPVLSESSARKGEGMLMGYNPTAL